LNIAHLILGHSNPQQIKRLADRLMHTDADIYIHLDKKTGIAPFEALLTGSNIHFITNRVKVYWGDYSIVQATINGFEEILATGKPYDYIQLMSGQDYPLQHIDAFHAHLHNNPGKVFMHYESVEEQWQEAMPRIKNYYLSHLQLPKGTYQAEKIVNAVLPKRKLPDGIVAMGRSQWFTASRESVAYIVDYIKKERWVTRFFKYSWAADEIIFQTILYNSPFREHMVNDNLLYLDWSKGEASPKVLTMADAPALQASGKFFARKFNADIDCEILDFLDNIAVTA
jgi:hypothetical protein